MSYYYLYGTNAKTMYSDMYGKGDHLKQYHPDIDASIQEQYQSRAKQNRNTKELYRKKTENVRKSTERIGKMNKARRGETLDSKVVSLDKKRAKHDKKAKKARSAKAA